MAEWKSRGYVLDSDEEADTSTNKSESQKSSLTSNDQREKFRYNPAAHESPQDRIVNTGPEFEETITSTAADDSPIRARSNVLSEIDEIDELQAGHYQITPKVHRVPLDDEPQSVHRSSISDHSPGSAELSSPSLTPIIHPAEATLVVQSPNHIDPINQGRNEDSAQDLFNEVLQEHGLDRVEEHIVSRVRNLRRRNPIQLHPYAIEGKNYRQTLKRRGVKPLRITQAESQSAHTSLADFQTAESLGRFGSQENGLHVRSLRSSSPTSNERSPSLQTSQNALDTYDNDAEDLPDMQAILRSMPAKTVYHSRKRRKITHSATNTAVDKQGSFTSRLASSRHQDVAIPDSGLSIFDMPPSPPHSQAARSSSPSRPNSKGFRFPRGISPVALPTPVASSEPGQYPVMGLDESSLSGDEITADVSSDGGAETPASVSPRIDHRRLGGVQRKIRGVLPASWLKLDLKAQARQSRQEKPYIEDLSPLEVAAQERGVARPVVRNSRSDRHPYAAIQIADSSSESGSDRNDDSTAQRHADRSGTPSEEAASLTDEDLLSPSNLWGEVIEDNHVDTMAPTISRNRNSRMSTHGARSRKKQTKLTGLRRLEQGSKQRKNNEDKAMDDPRPRPKRSEPQKPKFRPPAISLLDVSPLTKPWEGTLPNFARVAQRTVRSRNDRGRSLPNRKILQLHNESETNDANEYLRSWREGTLQPRMSRPSIIESRSPLQPCTNNQQNQLRIEASSTVQSRPSKTDLARPQNQVSKRSQSRRGQRPLDKLLIRHKEQDHDQQISHTPKHVQLKKVGDRTWKGRAQNGHLLSSLRDNDHPRPAALESSRSTSENEGLRSGFRHPMDRGSQSMLHNEVPNPLFAKFFGGAALDSGNAGFSEALPRINDAVLDSSHPRKHRKQRKRRPTRLDTYHRLLTDTIGHSLDENSIQSSIHSGSSATEVRALTGLGPFGTSYTTTFDVSPLPAGTYFTRSTFVGSGEFAKLLNGSDLDQSRGFYVFQYFHASFRWGPWDETLSSQAGTLIDETCHDLQTTSRQDTEALVAVLQRLIDLLENISRYFSSNLSFHDPVDRLSFLQRWRILLHSTFQELVNAVKGPSSEKAVLGSREAGNVSIRAVSLCMILANQMRQISKHDVVPNAVQTELVSIAHDVTGKALDVAFTEPSAGFLPCINDLKRSDVRPLAVHENHAAVETVVMAVHLQVEGNPSSVLGQALRTLMIPLTDGSRKDVQVLESRWETLFQILPFFEIDQHGVLEVGRRRKVSTDNWALVKCLVEPVLETLQSKEQRRSPSVNTYCRALFSRCYTLINDWEWCKSEPIIGVFFDFFAARNLAHLPNEESHGSPDFLEQLDQHPCLEPTLEDRCFHLFLKVVGSGIQRMQRVYTNKMIRSLVWRYIPNHGRFLPKDQGIHESDLDALRNHHGLLCTLYWASPPGSRPRPKIIQDLVDVQNSHKEACRINIRAWSNLITFQLSTQESSTMLEPFVSWCVDILAQLLRQHQQARTEAEEQVRQAESSAGFIINKSLLESTITQNQRQIEAILTDVLLAIKNAIIKAHNIEVAEMLLFPDLTATFTLFSAEFAQTNKVVLQSLDVFLAFTAKMLPNMRSDLSSDNEESQDYGDFPIIGADILNDHPSTTPADHLGKHFYGPLRQLMSNCFGADTPPEDAMLAKVIDAWIAMGRIMVTGGLRAWSDFIEGYEHDPWTSLRDTEQTRKFSACYLAAIVEADGKVLVDHKQNVMKAWAASLVERTSLLKYQHQLTSSLLNADPGDSLLANPPFWTTAGHFQIAPSEFAERRISLISNLLSNMRQSVQDTGSGRTLDAAKLKADYKEILRAMMSSMKRNYQELGQGPDVRGAYVDFVHQVIEFLQQHTSNICPVDLFFTDSRSFPLPVTDPTYVVGQLKNYGLRLHDLRTPKQLAVFVQSVSERAAVDGQQEYLVNQLSTAMTDNAGRKASGVSELCSFLLLAIFPVYIDVALNTTCGWIMTLPILDASTLVLSSIMTKVNGADERSVRSTSEVLLHFLAKLRQSLDSIIQQPNLMQQPKNLKIMARYLKIITVVTPTLDYLSRLNKGVFASADKLMQCFKSFALFGARSLLGHSSSDTEDDASGMMMISSSITNEAKPITQYADVQAFALQELQETLRKDWTYHEEQYYVLRGQTRRDVVVDVGLFEEERDGFVKEVEGLFNCLARMTMLGEV
ncbi:MAG: hypothetical protein Q9220_006618 [cf. Caloplaca sp. 1 TL-2023]